MTETKPTLSEHIEWVLGAARIAPSHDNLQPWRFVVDGDSISFLVDHERDRSQGPAAGRMARIAIGAAFECLLLRAGRMGATVRTQTARPGALLTVTVTDPKRLVEPDKALIRRTTNRRLYDGRALDDATFSWLTEATPAVEMTRTHWFGRERVRTLGPMLEEAEAIFYGDPHLREASLRAVRFDARDREEVTHGLSLGSLELSSGDRMTLDSLRQTPQDRLAAMGAFKKMGARARRLVESASGICVIAAMGSEPLADVAVGRSMQRAWLALTRRGLVAQPMSSVCALDALVEHDAAALAEGDRARAVVAAVRAAVPSLDKGARIGMLLRCGWAPAPTASVRRFPLEDSVASEIAAR